MDCLFCKIVQKKIPAVIIYENDKAVAFLDIHPRSPGHTVVIPKEHHETILAVPEADIGPLFQTVQHVTEMLRHALTPDGFTIGINQGKGGRVAINHLHIHIMPRHVADTGGDIQSVVENVPTESIESISEKIKINH